MPELPEAEAARRRIADGALNRTITGVHLGEVSHMDMPSERERSALEGTQFTRTHRHGKYIFVGSKGGPWLHIHLGMAGSVRVMDKDDVDARFIRLTVAFEGGTRLCFRDPRKFGHIALVDDPGAYIAEKGLGPDALEIGGNAFADAIGTTRGAVKSALLNQRKLAGVGNLWADETLYRTGVHPETRGDVLSGQILGRMHRDMQDILHDVVATGAVYSKLPDDWLIHHRDEKSACPRGSGQISKIKVGGRTSYFCPDHQVREEASHG